MYGQLYLKKRKVGQLHRMDRVEDIKSNGVEIRMSQKNYEFTAVHEGRHNEQPIYGAKF